MSTDFITRGQKEGFIREDINKQLVSKIIIEMYNILEVSDVFTLKEYSRKELFKNTVILYIRGICTPK